MNANLTIDDVAVLLGHAIVLRLEGKTDVPMYLFGIAERIALSLGDTALAQRVRDGANIAVKDDEKSALEYIKRAIAADKANGDYGHVEHEVVEEFMKYRKNAPGQSPMDHALSAMHACTHQ